MFNAQPTGTVISRQTSWSDIIVSTVSSKNRSQISTTWACSLFFSYCELHPPPHHPAFTPHFSTFFPAVSSFSPPHPLLNNPAPPLPQPPHTDTHTHTHTHTQDLHRRTICHAAGDNRGPPCHEGKTSQHTALRGELDFPEVCVLLCAQELVNLDWKQFSFQTAILCRFSLKA